ncbi:hypothetical protein KIPB_017279, partial [Kipferlia bialata]
AILGQCGAYSVPSDLDKCVEEGRKHSQAKTYIQRYGLTLGGLREFVMHGVKVGGL